MSTPEQKEAWAAFDADAFKHPLKRAQLQEAYAEYERLSEQLQESRDAATPLIGNMIDICETVPGLLKALEDEQWRANVKHVGMLEAEAARDRCASWWINDTRHLREENERASGHLRTAHAENEQLREVIRELKKLVRFQRPANNAVVEDARDLVARFEEGSTSALAVAGIVPVLADDLDLACADIERRKAWNVNAFGHDIQEPAPSPSMWPDEATGAALDAIVEITNIQRHP